MKNYLKLSVVAIAICVFAACSNDKGTEKQEKIIPVKILQVASSQMGTALNYVGTVEESVAVSLSFPSMGTVEQVFVSEGQRVQKGQLLATFNTATAENSYQMTLATQQQAQDAYDRLVKVHENGSLPDIKFVEIETSLQQAKAMTAVAKKMLDDCRLIAPRAGVIASRSIEVGTNAMPGTTAFRLVSVDEVYVKIPVSENEIGKISKGQKAQIEVSALNNSVFAGEVEVKGITANPMSHTYDVKIFVKNPQSTLMPGMVCKVSLAGDTETEQIVVPNKTIQISADGRHFVWLAAGNVAKRRFVEIGGLNDNGIIVVKGLSTGDRLIVEGFQKVSEGMKISF